MAKRIKDLSVKTGSYQTSDGQTKNRYENVGMIMEDDKGGKFILLKRSFNPAGVPFADGKDTIMVSLFDPRAQEVGERTPMPASKAPAGSLAKRAQDMLGGDEIPF